ncbi:MAG: tricarballylate utilization 4Fe-4S protein TcuB [Sulfurospirillaceae bacterium]|nr:tricarballylate utilization 4Fe-4S protein TcuB [Sulfurospirillaceae bacterium]
MLQDSIKQTPQDNLQEARRIMEICNACRYCESLCPVFPEITRFRTFSDHDLNYLANLCHNCKGCYYGCQYSPPHEFAINVPKTLAEVRVDSYARYAFPQVLGKLFAKNGTFVSIMIALCIALIFVVGSIFSTTGSFFATHSGEGSFYQVIPSFLMIGVPMIIGVYVLAAFYFGFQQFWLESGNEIGELKCGALWKSAFGDIMTLRHLDGGEHGHGCTHMDDRFSHSRRWFHQATMFGFFFAIISTSIAAIDEHILGLAAPYGFTSLPVIFGTLGGVMMVIGTIGLAAIKTKADPAPMAKQLLGMDYSFIVLLFLVSLSGLLLLALRNTALMPLTLCIHLGFVLAFFVTMPYSKFVHFLYRLGALLKFAKYK